MVISPGMLERLPSEREADEALRASEQKYRTLYNALDEGYFLIDVIFDEHERPVDLFYVEGNAAAVQLLGQDWAGKRLSEIGSGFEPYWLEVFGAVARTGVSVREERFAAPLEMWFDFYVFKMGGPESRRIGNTFRNITERKRAEEAERRSAQQLRESEEALREQREWLRVTLDSIGDAVMATDTAGRITFLNPVASALTGWPAEEAVGQPLTAVFRIINEKTRAPGENIVGRVLRQGRVVALANHSVLVARDGREIPIEDSAAPILDEAGRVRGVVLVYHDVTERRRAEVALQASEARYRSLAENVPSVLMRFDRQRRVVYLSPRAEEATGIPADQFLGKTNQQVGMPQHLCELWDRAMDEVFQRGEIRELEFDIESPSGPKTFYLKLAPEFGEDRAVAQILGVSTDITEHKRAEEALRRSAEQIENIIASIRDNFFVLDREWRFTHANAEAERQFRKTRQELLGHNVWELFPEAVGTAYWDNYQKAMSERVPTRFQSYYPPHDIWTEVSVYPTAEGIAVYCLDISALKQAEQALQDLNATLEQRVLDRTARLRKLTLEITRVEERERRRLARLLHDHLQQLLAAARLSLNMVRSRRLDPQRQVEILGQVDELLGESIDESRSLTAELSPPVLYDAGLAAAVEWLARWMLEKHHLRVEVEVADDVGRGEIPEGLRLVLFQGARELLFNVAKHAGVSEARMELRRLPGGPLELAVSDRGAGFDPAKIGRQATGGFGLFNIRERLESLGGQVLVTSTPGHGTCVILRALEQPEAAQYVASAAEVELPPAAPAARPRPEEADEAVRVLLVDDHTIMRQGLAYLLAEEEDLKLVGQAANGQEAVELAYSLRPDVVIMDITMPGMDGIEATRLITRRLPGTIVIGLTMHDGAEVAQRMREAGAMAHVPKGGDPHALLSAIRQCVAHAPRRDGP